MIECFHTFMNAGIVRQDFMTILDVRPVSQNTCQKTVNVMSVENNPI